MLNASLKLFPLVRQGAQEKYGKSTLISQGAYIKRLAWATVTICFVLRHHVVVVVPRAVLCDSTHRRRLLPCLKTPHFDLDLSNVKIDPLQYRPR